MNRYWLASLLLVSSCGSTHKQPVADKAATALTVATDRVSVAIAPQTAQASGTVQPRTRTVISAQVMGMIRQVAVEPGQSVQAGQTLILIDSQQLLYRRVGVRGTAEVDIRDSRITKFERMSG